MKKLKLRLIALAILFLFNIVKVKEIGFMSFNNFSKKVNILPKNREISQSNIKNHFYLHDQKTVAF